MELIQSIYFTLSIAGAFAVLDSFLPRHIKDNISNYVFGLHDVTFKDFETSVSHIWIDYFIVGLRLKLVRSVVCLLILYLGVAVYLVIGGALTLGTEFAAMQLLALVTLSIISLPCFYLNLLVSKTVYYGFAKNFGWIIKFLLDLSLSTIVLVILGYIAGQLILPAAWALLPVAPIWASMNGPVFLFAFAFAAGTIAGAYFYTRLAIFLFGVFARTAVKMSKVNFEIAYRSNVYDHPLAFLAVLSTLIILALKVLYGLAFE